MKTIAFLGPSNTHTYLAARARFGQTAKYRSASTVDEVFRMVECEEADLGVVPIENSLGGAVVHTLDRFIEFKRTPVQIQGEFERPIQHCLIMRRETVVPRIRVVYSHPQAVVQCQRWIDRHLPKVMIYESRSTAHAVHHLSFRRLGPRWKLSERAAIGPIELARKHGLKAIPIPEERENRTRFLILGLNKPRRGRFNKTSILVVLKDKPGALHDALGPFKQNKINLTKIESRPSKKKAWEYYFFIDLSGRESDPRVKRSLKRLQPHTTFLKILGSYPVAGIRGRG